ncbi:MAG: diguanylate cyclase [Blautia sp.]|nr:diguanylate cyclase [Blautia sp.]
MYSEDLKFLFISKSLWMEQVLGEVAPLEDCTYHFATYADFFQVPRESTGNNTAFIFDAGMLSVQIQNEIKVWDCDASYGEGVPYTAAVFFPDHSEMSDVRCEDVDYIWLLNAAKEDQMLRSYFQKLAREMKEKADARKKTICFQTLIDSSKDLIWFKDVDGRHLIVNDQFCSFVNKSKKQIYKQGHCYIWNASKEDEKVCLDSDSKIMQGTRTQEFEEQVHTNGEDYIIKSYKSPLRENGKIFGTCGIGQDITGERNLDRKLQIILDHIPFAIAVVSKEGILTYENRMFHTYFPEAVHYLGKDTGPLKEKLHFPHHIEEGELVEIELRISDEKTTWFSYYEKKILDVFDSQIEKMLVVQDITLKKKLEKQKERLAYTDYLTGLSNRRGMLKSLENDTGGLTVIMIDVDNFKKINDSLGHGTGDEVLKKFAEILKKVFAADFLIRYGGDEFLVITRLDEKNSIRTKMDSLLLEAGNMIYANGQKKGIHISCGISRGSDAIGCTMEQLIQMSDEAMYYIKKHGKHGFYFYDEMIGMK